MWPLIMVGDVRHDEINGAVLFSNGAQGKNIASSSSQ